MSIIPEEGGLREFRSGRPGLRRRFRIAPEFRGLPPDDRRYPRDRGRAEDEINCKRGRMEMIIFLAVNDKIIQI